MVTSTASSRALWKGAISFGLVHIPVALHSATSEQGLNFDWLDKRSMDPVGYKRVNKKTGKEIERENIVKGIEYEDGHYVILSEKEIAAAYPKTTQTIEIEMFVPATDIPFVYLERPYYIVPINKGGKVYALLREALLKTRRVGIARVVIQTKQHLAALVPSGPALVLNLLRWGDEIRGWENLSFPAEGAEEAGINDKELKMAQTLIDSMSSEWQPDKYRDEYRNAVMEMIEQKAKNKQLPAAPAAAPRSTNVVDLVKVLQESINRSKSVKVKRSSGGNGARRSTSTLVKQKRRAAAA